MRVPSFGLSFIYNKKTNFVIGFDCDEGWTSFIVLIAFFRRFGGEARSVKSAEEQD